MRLHKPHSQSAFSLIEVVVAGAIAALILTSLFTMNVSAMDTIRGAKESIAASQILQQRIESMRIANWHQVTDATWLRDNLLNADIQESTSLRDLTETVTIVNYGGTGAGNTQLKRAHGSASIVSQDATLLTQNAVKVLWTVAYTGSPNSQAVSRQIVAILAKGGVAK